MFLVQIASINYLYYIRQIICFKQLKNMMANHHVLELFEASDLCTEHMLYKQ